MSDPTDPLAWVQRAEEDWLLARSALRRKVPLIYGTTFHAQQCVEKYLKALLLSCRQAFPRTHDLIALHDLCMRNSISVPVDQDKLERLAAYAVQVRYPGEEPTLDEAREAVRIAQEVRRWARAVLRTFPQQP
jgi:HEPN domain-containing protein